MPTLSIELLKPHTHAGQHHAAGERLDLPEPSARWLIAQGVAKAVTPAVSLDPKPSRRDATASASHTSQGA